MFNTTIILMTSLKYLILVKKTQGLARSNLDWI